MGFLCFPKASRKLQRTLKNMRVSMLCFLLTFLVLRNTIGAGKFGTPAQDFEEIRLHLHNVGLHRRHFRVLAEAVEEEKPPLLTLEANKQRTTGYVESEDKDGARGSPVDAEEVGKVNKAPLAEKEKVSAPLPFLKKMQGNAALLALDIRHRYAPLLAAENHFSSPLISVIEKLEGLRISDWDAQRKLNQAPAHGHRKVLVVAGLQSSSCKKSAGEHLLLKSLKNKVDYSALHGLEVSLANVGGSDLQGSEPIARLSLLQSSMAKYPHVEWLWWVPNEALVITDITYEIPLHNYTEFNIVLLGSAGATYIKQENLIINLSTDTFLMRNCQWSLEVVQESRKRGSSMEGMGTDTLTVKSLISKPDVEVGDTSLYKNIPGQQGRMLQEKVYVVNSAVSIGGSRDMALRVAMRSHAGVGDRRLPFVTHFLGCQLCLEPGNEGDRTCLKQMERALLFAEKQFKLQRRGLDLSKA